MLYLFKIQIDLTPETFEKRLEEEFKEFSDHILRDYPCSLYDMHISRELTNRENI